MAKKPITKAMDGQPVRGDAAKPMAPAPTKRAEGSRAMGPSVPEAQAELIRQRALKKQRSLMAAGRKR